jgi:hypothetical protein
LDLIAPAAAPREEVLESDDFMHGCLGIVLVIVVVVVVVVVVI